MCAVCKGEGGQRSQLCSVCLEKLEKLQTAPACENCAMPIASDGGACPYCLGEGRRPIERIARLSVLRDPLRELIHRVKYNSRWALADLLADQLLEQPRVTHLLADADVIVPIPLHPWRQFSRGYNQADLIARRIGRRKRIKVSPALVRLKNTETQTHLHSKEKRAENLRDAFGLMNPRAVHDKHMVLLDDVMTTGATLISAARTIMEAEPASLCAIVVAVADARGRDFETI